MINRNYHCCDNPVDAGTTHGKPIWRQLEENIFKYISRLGKRHASCQLLLHCHSPVTAQTKDRNQKSETGQLLGLELFPKFFDLALILRRTRSKIATDKAGDAAQPGLILFDLQQ